MNLFSFLISRFFLFMCVRISWRELPLFNNLILPQPCIYLSSQSSVKIKHAWYNHKKQICYNHSKQSTTTTTTHIENQIFNNYNTMAMDNQSTIATINFFITWLHHSYTLTLDIKIVTDFYSARYGNTPPSRKRPKFFARGLRVLDVSPDVLMLPGRV